MWAFMMKLKKDSQTRETDINVKIHQLHSRAINPNKQEAIYKTKEPPQKPTDFWCQYTQA